MQKKSLMKILNNPVFTVLLLIPYFKPSSFDYISLSLDISFNIFKIFSSIIILLIYIYNQKISKIILTIILFNLPIFLSTAISGNLSLSFFSSFATILSYSMITEIYMDYNIKIYIKTIFYIYFILSIINLILLFIFPNGIALHNYYYYRFNFIGIDNQLIKYFIPIAAFGCIHSSFKNKKITLSFAILLCIISLTMIIVWSATGLVGWFIMILYILFIYKSKIAYLLNSILLSIFYAIIFLSIFMFNIQEYFVYIIENILKKSISFTGRTEIWEISKNLISKKPLLGYGLSNNHGWIYWHGKNYYTHNIILEVMIQGGILALIPYLIMFIIAAVSLYKYRSHYISGILSFAIFSMQIVMLTEAYNYEVLLYALIIMSCNISKIIYCINTNNEYKEKFKYEYSICK